MTISPSAGRRATPLPVALLLALLVAAVAPAAARDKPRDPYAPLESFTDALYFIQRHYVDEVDTGALIYDAISGMTGGLDAPSVYLSPDEYARFREETIGRYYGIGIITRPEVESAVIEKVFDRSPAERAGLRTGDRIVAVDGLRMTEEDFEARMHSIKGRRGTMVTLSIEREGEDTFDVEVARDRIRTPSVEHERLSDELAWVRIFQFQENTGREIRRALAELEDDGAALDGLVLDLRSNPGGFLDEAVAVADAFLDSGAIVTTRGRYIEESTEEAHAPGTRGDVRLVVLQDHGTASAAEIVAGALQDHRRATVLGTTSFGKGSVQTTYEFADGSALKLTIARYYTPSGRSIHGTGIEPDVTVLPRPIVDDEPGSSDPDEPDLSAMPDWIHEDPQMRAAVITLLSAPPAEP